MAHDHVDDDANVEVDARVPHLEVFRFYETELLKVARRGISAMDYTLGVVVIAAAVPAYLAMRANPVLALALLAVFGLALFALHRRTLPARSAALGEPLHTVNDLLRAIVGTQVTELEAFLSKHGWLLESQISHLCEIYNSWRADHREGRAWIGRWMITCVGFVLSAIVGATVSESISRGDKAFTRSMAQVALLLVMVTLLLYVVGNLLQLVDRRSHRLGGLVELLRAVQVRLVKKDHRPLPTGPSATVTGTVVERVDGPLGGRAPDGTA